MKFEEFKQSFFNNRTSKRVLVNQIKLLHEDFYSLLKFVNRFEKEVKSANSLLKHAIAGNNPLPKHYKELIGSELNYYTDSIEQEMNWQVLSFLEYSEIINKFINLRDRFEHYLLVANYQEARAILDEIEQNICVSYWSIENRYIIDEYQFGSEKNWETRNRILDSENNAFVQIFGNMFSLKTEKRISFFQYNEEFNNWQDFEGLNNLQQYKGLIDYFRFKGNYFSFSNYNHFSEILYRESNSSIIDRYIIFIRITQHLIIDQKSTKNNLKVLLFELYNKIKDISIRQMINSIDVESSSTNKDCNYEVMNILDEYSRGNYIKSKDLIKSFVLNKYSNYIELLEIYSKSLIEAKLEYEPITKEDSLINQICLNYYIALAKKEETDASLVEIVKLSYVFNNSHIGMHLYSFVTQQLGWETDINYLFIANLNSKFINPNLINHLYKNPDVAKTYINKLSHIYDNSNTVKLFKHFYDNYISLSMNEYEEVLNEKNKLYQIRTLLIKERFDECIKSCTLLSQSNISIISEYEVVSSLFFSYLKKNDYRSCLILNVNTYLKNPHLVKKMNVNSVIEEITKAKFKNVGSKSELIELPIFFKINYGDRIKIKQSYELYLKANNFSRPSELLPIKESIEHGKLIYFLKYVCIPEILQLSKSFDSTYEVNEERISICKFLSEIDKTDDTIYKIEIAELTQKNTISKVIGGIDERKIFVNESKIREIIKKSEKQNILQSEQMSPLTNESFERYNKLLSFVKNNNEYKDISSIIQFGENGDVTYIEVDKSKTYKKDTHVVLYLPAFRIFVTYFLHIRELFIFSKEYGLDAYLSTRIRHGTLPNHLRSIFETYYLVTSQTDNVYAENQYWKDKYSLTDEKMNRLQSVLGQFSMEIDTFSKEIKDSYIQCRNEKKNQKTDALFDYSYTEEDLMLLFLEDFENTENIDDFLDKSFQELWRRTEENLLIIQNKFNVEYRDKYVNLIENLQTEILTFTDRHSVSELINNLMICKTEIQTKLSNISKWFRRSESSFEGEYDLQILAETSIQITKNLNPSYPFDIEKNICKNFNIIGEYHQHFIDLINNFMFNIVKHSHLPCERLNAKLTIYELDNNLIMNFENCILVPTNHLERLGAIKENWTNLDTNINQEGGTGFSKIKKIIHSDLNRKYSNFDFNINDDRLNIIISFESNGLKV